ncbi:hemerythrin domain-containing protein [Amycolatopsis magusensis]|uniref:hemerythrin domain-containing protein n=1 Tax=Amycolatopsis magusensis TaxID=882444 RepID=UPI003C2B410F
MLFHSLDSTLLNTIHAGTGRPPNVRGVGDELKEVHAWLRGVLEEVRTHDREPGSALKDLRAHCTGFCKALGFHHRGEDEGIFPVVAQRFPALAPALDRLSQDHVVIARVLAEIEAIDDPARSRAEFDRLAALLDEHFEREERTIVPVLNALGPVPGIY